jgi:predicted RNA-binding Zn-ribbon protein involved in translation (DUF1610 family)
MMNREITICKECESEYYKDSSEMIALCPDCIHKLYGYPKCEHEFENGKCIKCGWNGKTSEYLKNREKKDGN